MKTTNRWPIWLIAAVVALVGLSWGWYVYADPEQHELDATVRARMPGQFAKLSDGYTHYELGGPSQGRVVVLAAGFSVPYYIWDPTFAALTAAGFRVLRYDYYGRGYSDRPAIPFTDEMYQKWNHDAYARVKTILTSDQYDVFLHEIGLGFGFVATFSRDY